MTQIQPDSNTPPRNPLALWSLILGLAGLFFSVIIVGGIMGLVALVLGIIAVTRPGKKGMAITGIVTGCLSLPIAVLAVPFWFLVVFGLGPGSRVASARRAGTIAEISNVKTALGIFETDVGRYPSTEEGLEALVIPPSSTGPFWKGPYMQKFPVDKWGHPFLYVCPGIDDSTSYDLYSAGPNGIPGDSDDILRNTEY